MDDGFSQGKDLGDGHRSVPQLVPTSTRTDQNQTEEINQVSALTPFPVFPSVTQVTFIQDGMFLTFLEHNDSVSFGFSVRVQSHSNRNV